MKEATILALTEVMWQLSYLRPAVAASSDLLLHLDADPPAGPARDVPAVPDDPAELLPVLGLQLDHAAHSHQVNLLVLAVSSASFYLFSISHLQS